MVICDHSELLQTISDLELENKQLRKQDMHREKIWKKRVTEMQRKNADLLEAAEDMDYTKKLRAKIAELTRENNDLMTLVIPELQLDLKDALAMVAKLVGGIEQVAEAYMSKAALKRFRAHSKQRKVSDG